MIVKLKNECGYQFTSKLEGMFTDMKISKVREMMMMMMMMVVMMVVVVLVVVMIIMIMIVM